MCKKTAEHNHLDIRRHISALTGYMSAGIYEKDNILSMALLCAVAGESIFLLGPPGTAKSLVARRLKMVFKDAKSFEYLMSRFSTPEEVFGPVSISKLKNEDKYERITKGFLPDATVVFLDEIWKAGPAIQNTLLTVINERIYKNGYETVMLPMKVLIAASNELPAEEQGLEALWDRFLVRMVSTCIVNEKTFFKMICQDKLPEVVIPSELLITDELFMSWQSSIYNVKIPDDVCRIVSNIRKLLKEEEKKHNEIDLLDFYVSDRRWKKLFHLMRTSAWLNGRSYIDASDCVLLIHGLWNKYDYIPLVVKCVCKAFTYDIECDVEKLHAKIDKVLKDRSRQMSDGRISATEESNDYKVVRLFYYVVMDFPKANCLFAKADLNHLSPDNDKNGIIYYDENIKNWIIHAIYTSVPFDYKMGQSGSIERIKIRKCQGGIIVNGIPYGFQRSVCCMENSLFGNLGQFSFQAFLDEYADLRGKYDVMLKLTEKNANLFVSDDDYKRVTLRIRKTGRLLDELYVKLNNSKSLL